MNYFRLMNNEKKFIGVASSYDFRKYQTKHSIIIGTDENDGQYIELNGDYYRDSWMNPVSLQSPVTFNSAIIDRIDEETYLALVSNQEVQTENEDEPLEDVSPALETEEQDLMEVNMLDYARSKKIAELEKERKKEFEEGFLFYRNTLEDPIQIRMSKDDQMRLVMASAAALNEGVDVITFMNNDRQITCTKDELSLISMQGITFETELYKKYDRKVNTVNELNTVEDIFDVKWIQDQ